MWMIRITPLVAWIAVFVPLSAATSSGDARDVDRLLDSHNIERKAAGAPPLAWNERLARAAAAWAQHLARTGKFEHADQTDGENLWQGGKSGSSLEAMVASWASEKRYYRSGRFPNVSTTGDADDVGHYTQMIWSRTTQVGCGLASNAENTVLVCRYSPPGNVSGQLPLVKIAPRQALKKRRRGG